MVIGAFPSDYSSIIDKSPPSFGIFYWTGHPFPVDQYSALITKQEEGFLYEFTSATGEVTTTSYAEKDALVEQMQLDNRAYNAGGKCTVEF